MQTARRQASRFSSRFSALAVLTLACTLLGAAASVAATPASLASPAAGSRPAAAKAITWMISSSAIKDLESAKPPPPKGLIAKAFSGAFVMGTPIGLGVPVKTYTSYVTLKQDVEAKKLPGPYAGVLLDLEDWQFTPKDEQLNSGKFERLAEKLVHSLKLKTGHLTFITAPALDLVTAICKARMIACSGAASVRQHYLDFGLARQAAGFSDVVDIQAQSDELHLSSFTKFVAQAVGQARKGNSTAKVVVGLSTDNGMAEVSGAHLIAAFNAADGVKNVAGFWLNIPGHSKFCPGCGGPFPGPALKLLEKIYG